MSANRHDFFRLWLILLILLLVTLYPAWWWLGGAEWVLRGLRLMANALLPHFFSQGISEVTLLANQSWKVLTGLNVEDSHPAETAIFFITEKHLLRSVMGFPLLWALLLATPGSGLKRLVWGTLLLGLISLLGLAGHMWATIGVMVNHQPSSIDENLVPPPYRVSGVPYSEWLFHLSGFAHYLEAVIVPIIAPVLIWVLLCPRGVMRLVVSVRRRIRR